MSRENFVIGPAKFQRHEAYTVVKLVLGTADDLNPQRQLGSIDRL